MLSSSFASAPFAPTVAACRRQGRLPCSSRLTCASASSADALWSWLREQGVDTSAVQPREAADCGLGLFCTRALRAKEAALIVPRSLWMTAETAAASPLGPHLAGLAPWVALSLHLLAERAAPASRWAPYLALLPAHLDSPTLWSEEELRELDGSQLGASAASYRAFVAQTYAELQAGTFAAAPATFPAAVFSESAFAWAFATLRARCLAPVDSGADIALVPGLDLLNHGAGEAPAWSRAGEGLLAAFSGGAARGAPAALAIVPARPFAAGEQLLGSYGDGRLDSQLALDFGFVDRGRPAPGYLLQLSLPEEDRFFDDKQDVCEVAKLPVSPQFPLRPGAPPPADLRTFLRLLNLGGTDAFLLEPLFRESAWNIISEPVSLANEQAACESMIGGCTDALAGYATGAREDEEALRAPGSVRRDMTLRVRLGEKRGLSAALESFQTLLAQAPRLDFYQERRLRSLRLLDDSGASTFDPFSDDSFSKW